MMRKDKLDHLFRAAGEVTGHRCFVLVGSAVVLIRCRNIPGDMLLTPEADLYVPDVPNSDDLSDAIDANIGQGSSFHQQYGYYCDGVSPETALMPIDWSTRTTLYASAGCPGITVIVPDPDDVALAKAVAWREKDKDWLTSGLRSRLLSIDAMAGRLPGMPAAAPPGGEMKRRLVWLAAECELAFVSPP